jgi:protein associated with RNAse G/E
MFNKEEDNYEENKSKLQYAPTLNANINKMVNRIKPRSMKNKLKNYANKDFIHDLVEILP